MLSSCLPRPHGEDEGFAQAMGVILMHESIFNHASDSIHETFSEMSLFKKDKSDLNLEQVTKIYYEKFWKPYNYGAIQDQKLKTKVFDLSVTVGPTMAHQLLQRALSAVGRFVVEDGILGPDTLKAANSAAPRQLLAALKSEAAGYYRVAAINRILAIKQSNQSGLNQRLKHAYA